MMFDFLWVVLIAFCVVEIHTTLEERRGYEPWVYLTSTFAFFAIAVLCVVSIVRY